MVCASFSAQKTSSFLLATISSKQNKETLSFTKQWRQRVKDFWHMVFSKMKRKEWNGRESCVTRRSRAPRLIPSRYLFVLWIVVWSERSARGVTGRGYFSFASFQVPSFPARYARSKPLSLLKQKNSDWVRVWRAPPQITSAHSPIYTRHLYSPIYLYIRA